MNWKTALGWTGAILSAIVFLVAGLFHLLDPIGAAVLMTQVKLPQALSVPFALGLGTVETLTGILFLLPGYRRWASWLGVFLLAAFMAYIGYYYRDLIGVDCSCFPWVKRAVGPAFFVEDAAMMLFAVLAGVFSRKPRGLRTPLVILAAAAVFGGASLMIAHARQTGTKAPDTILVDGKPHSISSGRVFLYFYDPECMHCLDAGERMAKMNWGDVQFVGVPVVHPEFAPAFVDRTGLKNLPNAVTTSDFPLLKKTFPYKSTPAGVAIENGRQIAALNQFSDPEPAPTLRTLKFAQ